MHKVVTVIWVRVQVNLGRALTKAGRFAEAVRVYENLEAGGGMADDSAVRLCSATAMAGNGDPDGAMCVLQSILQSDPPPKVLAAIHSPSISTRASLTGLLS